MKPLNVLITRPRAQAEKLAERVSAAGFIPVVTPMIEIVALESAAREPAIFGLKSLVEADAAVAVSANAFSFGRQIAQEENITLPKDIAWFAVGEATADVMRAASISPALPEGRFDSEGLLSLPELQNVKGKTIAIFTGQGGRRKLETRLQELGASIVRLEFYSRSPIRGDQVCVDKEPDVLTAMSGETITPLRNYIDFASKESWLNKPLFVPSARTAEIAFDTGFKVVRVTKQASENSLLEALCQYALEV